MSDGGQGAAGMDKGLVEDGVIENGRSGGLSNTVIASFSSVKVVVHLLVAVLPGCLGSGRDLMGCSNRQSDGSLVNVVQIDGEGNVLPVD